MMYRAVEEVEVKKGGGGLGGGVREGLFGRCSSTRDSVQAQFLPFGIIKKTSQQNLPDALRSAHNN